MALAKDDPGGGEANAQRADADRAEIAGQLRQVRLLAAGDVARRGVGA